MYMHIIVPHVTGIINTDKTLAYASSCLLVRYTYRPHTQPVNTIK